MRNEAIRHEQRFQDHVNLIDAITTVELLSRSSFESDYVISNDSRETIVGTRHDVITDNRGIISSG